MWSFRRELLRKGIHLLILLVIILYSFILKISGKTYANIFLVCLLALFLIFEFMRLDLGVRIPFFDLFIRTKEQDRMYGAIYFLCGAVISFSVFAYPIALTALLMTAFGDLTASLVGHKWGKTKLFRQKTYEGSIAGFIVNLMVGVIVLFSYGTFHIALIMAIVATIVEVLSHHVDDNLAIPVIAGLVGQLLA